MFNEKLDDKNNLNEVVDNNMTDTTTPESSVVFTLEPQVLTLDDNKADPEDKEIIRFNKCAANEGIKVVNVTCRGTDHFVDGTVCQDYSEFKIYSKKETINAIFIVSDGHGSVKRSQYGSKFIAQVLIEICEDLNNKKYTNTDVLRFFSSHESKKDIIKRWSEKVLEHAIETKFTTQEDCNDVKKKNKVVDQYGATMLFTIILEKNIIVGNIGDGGIFLVERDGNKIYPYIEDSGDIGESTKSLCHLESHYINVSKFSRAKFKAIVMTTDGISKPYMNSMEEITLSCAEIIANNDINVVNNNVKEFMLDSHPQIGDDITLLLGEF